METNLTSDTIFIDFSKLPPVPQVLLKLVEACQCPDIGLDELKGIIEKDVAITNKILTMSNSAGFLQWNHVTDLTQLLVILGVKTIKTIALTSAVHQFFSKFDTELGKAMGAIWRDSLMCAHVARSLAVLTAYKYPDEAYLAGLLHKVGQLAMLHNMPDKYLEIIVTAESSQSQLQQEQVLFGINASELAGKIVSTWDSESTFSDALRYQHYPVDKTQDSEPLVKLVNFSCKLVNGHSSTSFFEQADTLFGLRQSLIEELWVNAKDEVVKDIAGFGIDISADQLATLELQVDDEHIRVEIARKVRQVALLDGVRQHIADIDDVTEIMTTAIQDIGILFGLYDTNVFLYSADNNQSSDNVGSLNGLVGDRSVSIPLLPSRSLVTEALYRRKIIASSQQSIFDILPIVDNQIARQLGCDSILCLPLVSHEQNFGVIVVGMHDEQTDKIIKQHDLMSYFSSVIADALHRQKQRLTDQEDRLAKQSASRDLELKKLIHEANNPLGVICNYLEVLSIKLNNDTETQQHLSTIKEEIGRVTDIVLRMKAPEVSATAEYGLVDVNGLLEQLLGLFNSSLFITKNISISKSFDPNIPEIQMDPHKLKQIYTNLLKNAAEALDVGGEISISTKDRIIINGQQFIEISVIDNGPGLPEPVLDNLFRPVQSTKGGNHSGLGLAIVNNLVNELGGSVSYKSSAKDGAEFLILLPRRTAAR